MRKDNELLKTAKGPGAPKKPYMLKKVNIGYKLPRWMIKWLRTQDNATKCIETALIEKYNLAPPEDLK